MNHRPVCLAAFTSERGFSSDVFSEVYDGGGGHSIFNIIRYWVVSHNVLHWANRNSFFLPMAALPFFPLGLTLSYYLVLPFDENQYIILKE